MKIRKALISVYHKEGLDEIISELAKNNVEFISTGGTQKYIESLGYSVTTVEQLTGFPSILDGRVKTLHPAIFAGILARREENHRKQLESFDLPEIDLVIVDLYPFEETVKQSNDPKKIIEKIDIGGISLIRAAAKNHNHIAVISSQDQYPAFLNLLQEQGAETKANQRLAYALQAFYRSSLQDVRVSEYLQKITEKQEAFRLALQSSLSLRYGENPHQSASFYGNLNAVFDQIHGKKLSYNNLVDIDAAVDLIHEFWNDDPTFAIIKHTNCCGLAQRKSIYEAWKDALAGDPVSAFGGIFVSNRPIDKSTAEEMHKMFFEVIIAPAYDSEAEIILKQKKKRVLLVLKNPETKKIAYKSILNGVIQQDLDLKQELESDLEHTTSHIPTNRQIEDMLFANISVKHLKSNAISIVKNKQLLGIGCGQTSRVDALRQAIHKAKSFGLELKGAVLASDAFFPFSDCVQIAHENGICAVIQPGGSIRDKDSIEFCEANGMSMAMTGHRHFRH